MTVGTRQLLHKIAARVMQAVAVCIQSSTANQIVPKLTHSCTTLVPSQLLTTAAATPQIKGNRHWSLHTCLDQTIQQPITSHRFPSCTTPQLTNTAAAVPQVKGNRHWVLRTCVDKLYSSPLQPTVETSCTTLVHRAASRQISCNIASQSNKRYVQHYVQHLTYC